MGKNGAEMGPEMAVPAGATTGTRRPQKGAKTLCYSNISAKKWPGNGAEMGPEMEQKWTRNGAEMDPEMEQKWAQKLTRNGRTGQRKSRQRLQQKRAKTLC